MGAVDEELRMEPLAHQPALHVDLADDDGVDPPRKDIRLQLFE